ncbi:MAG TPA: hypothetical protein PLW93_02435 [Candidatus Absconditabacterales bacterium]|nr:hypothetical protein [Candidatus Absconditabacterales bacterium]
MADIGALSFSDAVIEMNKAVEEQKELETKEVTPQDPVVEVKEEKPIEQKEEVPKEEEKTLDEINRELEQQQSREELHDKVNEIIEQNKQAIESKVSKKKPEDIIEEMAGRFYEAYDQVVAENNRLATSNKVLTDKLQLTIDENEELKYQLRRGGNLVDDDIKYISKLKKDELAADEYIDYLVGEVSRVGKLNKYEVDKNIKEQRRRALEALNSSTVETKVDNVVEEGPKQAPIFEGFKLSKKLK